MSRFQIVGPGRLGGAIAIGLDAAGMLIDSIVFRTALKAERIATALSNTPVLIQFGDRNRRDIDVVLLTCADTDIDTAAAGLSQDMIAGTVVLHTSGSLSSDILGGLRSSGCSVGSMHPLVSISDASVGSEAFAGGYFCIEGDEQAVLKAREISNTLGAIPFSIETRFKPLYHAAAVTSSGHFVALIDTAMEMMSACGLTADRSMEILMPLIDSTLANLKRQTPQDALTGTYARGDIAGIERHLDALAENVSENALDIYLELAERSISLAENRGLSPEIAEQMRALIEIAKKNTEC